MMRSGNVIVAAGLFLLLAAPGLAGEEVDKEGVLHIRNGSEPSGEKVVVELEEVWRHGGEDDEDFFGMISQCVVGADGTIYLLDTRMSEVPVYSPDGERIATLSREGDGPGETRIPSGLLFMPDGNLGLVQVFPGKITKIATDGTPVGVVEISDPSAGGFMQMFDCVAGGSQVVVTAEAINPEGPTAQTRVNFVAAFDDEGKETVRYFENSYRWDFTNFTYNESEQNRTDFRRVAVGRDGRVYVAAERDAYQINVYTADGQLERVIHREYEHRPRDDEDYEQIKTSLEAAFAQVPGAKIVPAKTEPDIGSLEIGSDGNLWVSTSRSGTDQPEGILTTWDVFDPDGHFIKTVSAKCEGDGENDILIWTPDGNAVLVTGFVEALAALQGGGGGGGEAEDDEEAEPMEVIYLKVAGT
jgi:sugar lactone lactonase YvrE